MKRLATVLTSAMVIEMQNQGIVLKGMNAKAMINLYNVGLKADNLREARMIRTNRKQGNRVRRGKSAMTPAQTLKTSAFGWISNKYSELAEEARNASGEPADISDDLQELINSDVVEAEFTVNN